MRTIPAFILLVLSCVAVLAAQPDKDLGLHSDGGPWQFYCGEGDHKLPRVLLIGDSIISRNAIAARLMRKLGIPVNDLYGLMSDKLNLGRGDKYHWNGQAYGMMAKQIVSRIAGELNKANRPKTRKP